MPPTPRLFIVREKLHGQKWRSLPEKVNVRAKGVFTSRGEAEAFRARAERDEARSGNFWPLYPMEGLSSFLEFSNFDEGVLLDWLLDHDIPHPSTVTVDEENDPWLAWLQSLGPEKLAHLYEALHHFSFFEIVEISLVEGEYRPEDWEDWELHIPDPPPPQRPLPGTVAFPNWGTEDDIPF